MPITKIINRQMLLVTQRRVLIAINWLILLIGECKPLPWRGDSGGASLLSVQSEVSGLTQISVSVTDIF